MLLAGYANVVLTVVVPFPATVANGAPPQLVENSTVPKIFVAAGKVAVNVPVPEVPAQIAVTFGAMLVGSSLL